VNKFRFILSSIVPVDKLCETMAIKYYGEILNLVLASCAIRLSQSVIFAILCVLFVWMKDGVHLTVIKGKYCYIYGRVGLIWLSVMCFTL
jgi:hypothetical protein